MFLLIHIILFLLFFFLKWAMEKLGMSTSEWEMTIINGDLFSSTRFLSLIF